MINWCIEKPNEGEVDRRERGRDEGAGGLHLLVQPELAAGARHALISGPSPVPGEAKWASSAGHREPLTSAGRT